jgi:hypothetical protein
MKRTISTPWGASQTIREERPGITWTSTASHGGYMLDAARMDAFRQRFPAFTPYAGSPWFEEDQDAAAVVLAFPDEFTDEQVRDACQVARYSARPMDFGGGAPQRFPGWESIVTWLDDDPAGSDVQRRANAFESSQAGMYERGSMGTTRERGRWWVSMMPVGGGDSVSCVMDLETIHAKRFFTREEVDAAAV